MLTTLRVSATSVDLDRAMSLYRSRLTIPSLYQGQLEVRTRQTAAGPLQYPYVLTGAFARVYCIVGTAGVKRAVRCFYNVPRPEYQQRYNVIAQFFRQNVPSITVDFKFHEKALRIEVKPTEVLMPIIEMEWVEGETLLARVDRLALNRDTEGLRQLAARWVELIQQMRAVNLAHGDLSGTNVMVRSKDGSLVLIDYDGVYLPAFAGQATDQAGHPSYQHPDMLNRPYDERTDSFSALLIYVALSALSEQPDLWKRYSLHDSAWVLQTDEMLFQVADLRNPAVSKVFADLQNINQPRFQELLRVLRDACQGPVNRVPDFPTVIRRVNLRSPVISVRSGTDPWLATQRFINLGRWDDARKAVLRIPPGHPREEEIPNVLLAIEEGEVYDLVPGLRDLLGPLASARSRRDWNEFNRRRQEAEKLLASAITTARRLLRMPRSLKEIFAEASKAELAEALVEKAIEQRGRGDFAGAATSLIEANDLDPRYARVQFEQNFNNDLAQLYYTLLRSPINTAQELVDSLALCERLLDPHAAPGSPEVVNRRDMILAKIDKLVGEMRMRIEDRLSALGEAVDIQDKLQICNTIEKYLGQMEILRKDDPYVEDKRYWLDRTKRRLTELLAEVEAIAQFASSFDLEASFGTSQYYSLTRKLTALLKDPLAKDDAKLHMIVRNLPTRPEGHTNQASRSNSPTDTPDTPDTPNTPSVEDRQHEIERSYPYPLASTFYQAYRGVDRDEDRHDYLLNLFEVTLKYCAAIALSQYFLDGAADAKLNKSIQDLRRPSLGHWYALLRDILALYRREARSLLVPALEAFYIQKDRDALLRGYTDMRQFMVLQLQYAGGRNLGVVTPQEFFELLLDYRNLLAHGAKPSGRDRSRAARVLEPAMVALFQHMRPLAAYPIVYIREIQVASAASPSGLLYDHYYTELRGNQPSKPRQPVTLASAARPHQLYIFADTPAPAFTPVLSLHPFLIFQHCDQCNREQVFILNESRDKVDYISYQHGCGHHLKRPEFTAILDGLLDRVGSET